MASVKAQDANSEQNLGLLAALIMAEGFLERIMEESSFLTDLIEILKNAKKIIKKNKGLVKNCLIAVGRIADVNYEVC